MEFFTSPSFFIFLMVCGTCLLLLVGFPVSLSLAGSSLLFAFAGVLFDVFDFSFISAFPQRIFAIIRNEVLIAVPLFIFMGVVLERSKIAEDLLTNISKLFDSFPGGLGIAVFIVGALMAASTGIVGATVVTMGLLSLPVMLKQGYDKSLSTGCICASGTLGQIIPPSIVLVLLGDQLSTAYQQAQYNLGNFSPDTISVNDLFAGALIPGLSLVGMYILYFVTVCIKTPNKSPSVDAQAMTEKLSLLDKKILYSLIPPIGLIVAVLGSILAGFASPTESASVGVVGALLLAGFRLNPVIKKPIVIALAGFVIMIVLSLNFDLRMQRKVITYTEWFAIGVALICSFVLLWGIFKALWQLYLTKDGHQQPIVTGIIRETLTCTTMVFTILIGASMFALVFRGYGGDEMIEEFLSQLPGGTLTVLLLVMLTMFLLGFILDFLEIIFIVVPIVAPILLTMEIAPGVVIDPIWLGVMMAINLQTSFLTPPFGFSLFYLKGVAPKTVTTAHIYRGAMPYVFIQILMLIILWYFPAIATWLPESIYGQ